MLAEFLADQGDWTQVMPGARACLFSLGEGLLSPPLRLEPLHFEALFCLAGSMTLAWRDGSTLTAGARQVLLLTNLSGVVGASVDAPLEGVLVAVDARNARESLNTICGLLGGLTLDTGRVRRWMASRGGCAVEGPTDWSRAVFSDLTRLPHSERARWCVWKSVELLYLLSTPGEQPADTAPALEREVARALADTRRYMEAHLDEPLTISTLSRRACLSATTFKAGFRRLSSPPPPSRRASAACTACPSTPGCGSGGWSGRRSCCGAPPSACWGWPSRWDTAAPVSSPPPSGGSTA